MKILAPFTPEQVEALNRWQTCGYLHGFTCGNKRTDEAHREAHRKYQAEHGGDVGQLIAADTGWFCPVCDYTQNWAHDFMTWPLPPNPLQYLKACSSSEQGSAPLKGETQGANPARATNK